MFSPVAMNVQPPLAIVVSHSQPMSSKVQSGYCRMTGNTKRIAVAPAAVQGTVLSLDALNTKCARAP
jgi:hypothetical protein